MISSATIITVLLKKWGPQKFTRSIKVWFDIKIFQLFFLPRTMGMLKMPYPFSLILQSKQTTFEPHSRLLAPKSVFPITA